MLTEITSLFPIASISSASAGPLAPSWLVLPMALIAMIAIASHLMWIRGFESNLTKNVNIQNDSDGLWVGLPLNCLRNYGVGLN